MPVSLELYILTFVFLGGLCSGSFLNVVIHRFPLGESIVSPRSRCPSCKGLIPWFRNIPLLSWALQRARCASCKAAISWRYPLVELLTGILFTAAAATQPYYWAWPFHFFLLGSLVASTFIDLDHFLLPDRITLPGIVVGILSSFVVPGHEIFSSLAGVLFGGGILYAVAWGYFALTGKEGLGGGDIKFLAMVGAFLGFQGALITLVFSSLVGSFVGIFLIVAKGKKGGTAIPFGPFLAGGTLLAFFFGEPVWRWYFGIT